MTPTHHHHQLSRREMICLSGAGLAVGTAATTGLAADVSLKRQDAASTYSFRYCLNMATIRGQKLPLPEQVRVAAQAGYDAIEPWLQDVADYAQQGGSLADVKKQAVDLGLSVESAVGFTNWITDEPDRGPGGFERWKRDFELIAALGGKRICAPPSGIAAKSPRDLLVVAARYRKLVELGRQAGVVPELELWGHAKTLCRLGEMALVMIEAAVPEGCTVLDVFHVYKSGSDFAGLRLMSGGTLHVFHMNDYPADPPRDRITDASRVYPGDGVAPLTPMLRNLRDIGFQGMLSIELFNRDYWKQDALSVARTGLEKMRASVAKALA